MHDNMKPGKVSLLIVSPVLFAFFIMSFCDLVGIGVDNAKADFQLSNTLAQLIPLAVFAWFFILSVPVGILQDRIGKKNMVNISMLITAGGLLLPFFYYSFPTLLIGFALLGIGNTIIQVSANPLLIDVVPQRTRSSFLSFSQFVKAVGSMIAPYLASFFAIRYGNWKLVFLIFGVFSILSVLWLQLTKITETRTEGRRASFTSALRLLGEPYIALMVLGIFLLVGIDVGINSTSGQFLMERLGMEPEPAKMGRSLYFFGKMLGTFSGALLLTRINTRNFLLISAWATLVSLLVFLWSPFPVFALVLMFLMGLASSNIFPLIFVLTAGRYSSHTNEISGLIIMAVSGGAFIPPLAGKITDMGGVIAGMLVFVGCAIYLLFLAYKNLRSPGKLL